MGILNILKGVGLIVFGIWVLLTGIVVFFAVWWLGLAILIGGFVLAVYGKYCVDKKRGFPQRRYYHDRPREYRESYDRRPIVVNVQDNPFRRELDKRELEREQWEESEKIHRNVMRSLGVPSKSRDVIGIRPRRNDDFFSLGGKKRRKK